MTFVEFTSAETGELVSVNPEAIAYISELEIPTGKQTRIWFIGGSWVNVRQERGVVMSRISHV